MSELDEELNNLANEANKTESNGGQAGVTTTTDNQTAAGTGTTVTEVKAEAPATLSANPNAHWEKFWNVAETQSTPQSEAAKAAEEEVKAEVAPTLAGSATGTPEPKNIGAGKITKQAIDNGATTVVGAINLGLLTIARPLLKWRTNKEIQKRFGADSTRAMELYMDDVPPGDQRERAIKKRFEKLMKERDRKIAGIPLTDEEEADMKYSLKQYFEMKQVAMSPELMLYINLFTILGKRAIDVAMWD